MFSIQVMPCPVFGWGIFVYAVAKALEIKAPENNGIFFRLKSKLQQLIQ